MPGEGAHYVMTAGSTATILRQVDDRVIVQLPSKLQVSLSKYCMASIGKLNYYITYYYYHTDIVKYFKNNLIRRKMPNI